MTAPVVISATLGESHLPTLPPGVPYLLSSLNDEDLGFRELATVVERVPTIAARLLSLANSAWVSPVSPVTSLETACSMLGFNIVRSVSIALAVSAPFSSHRCPAFDVTRFWESALLTAETAQRIMNLAQPSRLDGLDAGTARTGGLLHHLGLVWMADSIAEETNDALEQVCREPELTLNDALHQHTGIGYDEAGAHLAQAWSLPQPLVTAMSCQHPAQDDSSLAIVVASAGDLVSGLLGPEGEFPEQTLLPQVGFDDHSRQTLQEQISGLRANTHELALTLFK